MGKKHFGVSVIIPCYNAGAFIDDAVHSVLKQEADTPYEIIIVDDGSSDALTLGRVDYFEDLGDDRVSVIRHDKNMGLSVTRNTAIAASVYPYILPLDADDRLVTDKLSTSKGFIDLGAERLSGDPDLDVVSPQGYMFGNVSGKMRFPRLDEKRMLYKNHIPTFSMIRKSVVEDVGGYT